MQAQGGLDEILSRFPGPVTLYPSRRRWLGILLGCAAFVAIGVWMLISTSTGDGSFANTAIAWFAIVFFGIGVVVAAVTVLPGAGALKLDRDGFEITKFFRRHSVRWPDATGFAMAAIPPAEQKMVVFDDAHAGGGAIARWSVSIAGHNASLPDTYGLPAEDLASLMTRWRDRAVERR